MLRAQVLIEVIHTFAFPPADLQSQSGLYTSIVEIHNKA